MKELALKTAGVIWTTFWVILLAPFLIPAYGIAKLLGADPMSLDGMGLGFLIMAIIAGGLFIASVGFVLGTLF
jgi:hypothetical protein